MITASGKHPPRFEVLGVGVSVVTMRNVVGHISEWQKDKIGRYVCVRDVTSLMLAVSDDKLRIVYQNAAIVTPDGMPLVWIGRGLGHRLDRVCGPDLMHEICVTREGMGLKHYFYGGKPGVAKKLKEKLQEKSPELKVVGIFCPPFRDLSISEENEVTQMIINSEADIIWVGISSPKQDNWMAKQQIALSQTMIGVGAAFDFLSDEIPRAPVFMQRRGLEWIFRLLSEPKRLWRRYLVLVPTFIFSISKSGMFITMIKGAMKK